jgi:hypothetical protein
MAERPQLAIIGGPPIYLSDFRMSRENVDTAKKNIEVIVRHVPVTILDHHLLRDENWREIMQPVFDAAFNTGHKVFTAAEFAGEKSNILESRRKTLYEIEPPSREFTRWARIPSQKRKLTPPPV